MEGAERCPHGRWENYWKSDLCRDDVGQVRTWIQVQEVHNGWHNHSLVGVGYWLGAGCKELVAQRSDEAVSKGLVVTEWQPQLLRRAAEDTDEEAEMIVDLGDNDKAGVGVGGLLCDRYIQTEGHGHVHKSDVHPSPPYN